MIILSFSEESCSAIPPINQALEDIILKKGRLKTHVASYQSATVTPSCGSYHFLNLGYRLVSGLLRTRVLRQRRRTSRALHLRTHACVISVLGAHLADDSLVSHTAAAARGSSRDSSHDLLTLSNGGRGLGLRSRSGGACGSCGRSGRPVGGSADGAHNGGADAVFGLDVLFADVGGLGDVAAAAVFALFLSGRCEGDAAEEKSGGGDEEAHDGRLLSMKVLFCRIPF